MKFAWSLVHWQWPETAAAISYCSQLDGKNMGRLGNSVILSMDKKIVLSRKMLKITVIDVLSISKMNLVILRQGGWIQSQMATTALEPDMEHLAPKSLWKQHRQMLNTQLFPWKLLQLLQLNIKLFWLQVVLTLRHFYSSLPEYRNTLSLLFYKEAWAINFVLPLSSGWVKISDKNWRSIHGCNEKAQVLSWFSLVTLFSLPVSPFKDISSLKSIVFPLLHPIPPWLLRSSLPWFYLQCRTSHMCC